MAQRIVTGTILIVALIILLAFGGWVFAIAAFLAFSIAIHEELRALEKCGHHPVWWVSFVGLAVSVPLVMLYSYSVITPILALLSFCVLFLVMRRENPDLVDIMVSVLPMLTVVFPGMSLFGILATEPRSMQLFLLILVFVIAIGGDTFAYFVGSRIGGAKLCPNISPKKTVSGAVGGLLASILLVMLVGWIFQMAVPDVKFPPFWANMLAGLFGGIAEQMGDLFASMVKRHCGVKDFGTLFPGHGGMLDRLDSILFSAVIVFCYQVIWVSFS